MQFLNNFYTVFVQVLILFIFMGFGFVGEKKKLISGEGSKVISDIILYFVTPCLIINSLNIKFDSDKLSGLLICLVAFFVIQIASVLLVCLLFKKDHISTRVLRFAVVFSNVGIIFPIGARRTVRFAQENFRKRRVAFVPYFVRNFVHGLFRFHQQIPRAVDTARNYVPLYRKSVFV